MAENNISTYTGKTLKYPLEINSLGNVVTITGQASVEQSIVKILSTPIGTMFMKRDYGSGIMLLIFEQNDDVLKSLLRYFILEALNRWEKRIRYLRTDFIIDGDTVNCTIHYRIIATNMDEAYIYPFYRKLAV